MPPLSSRSFYRDLLQDAWHTAWRARLGWLLAIAAGLLQTGGIIDVLLRVFQKHLSLLAAQGQGPAYTLTLWQNSQHLIASGGTRLGQLFVGIKLSQALLLGALFIVTILVLSIVCQGALVYLVGARGRFIKPTVREALKRGGDRLWAVAALNLLPLGAYVFAWFICLAPFGTLIKLTSVASLIAYVAAVIFALAIGFVAGAVHMLALQNVVLDEAHVLPAIKKAWQMVRRSWLTLLETSLGLFVIGIAMFLASITAFVVIALPLLAMVGIAIVFQAPTIANAILFICAVVFILIMGSAGGLTIAFQYTVWNRLSSRLQKNLAVAKVIRSVHTMLDRLRLT